MRQEITQELLTLQGEEAQRAGDWSGALQAWACMLALYPGDWFGMLGLGTVFQNLGLADRAAAVIQAAMRQMPEHAAVLTLADTEAATQDKPLDRLRRWKSVLDRFPIRPDGYLKMARNLLDGGRLDEADIILEGACVLFLEGQQKIKDESVFKELAKTSISVAFQRKAWPDVVRRWNMVRNWHSPSSRLMLEIGNAFAKLKRLDEAEAMFGRIIDRDPQNVAAAIQYAQIAKDDRRPEHALQRWRAVVARFPDHAVGYAGVGSALLDLDRFDEAETFMSAAMQRFVSPLSQAAHSMAACQIAVIHGRVADGRGDHQDAFRRWEALHKIVPAHPAVEHGLGAARLKLQIVELDSVSAAASASSFTSAKSAGSEDGSDHDKRSLMLCFESLGMNCEFGLVQRHFAAEPLGLLRWGVTDPDMLFRLLDARFEGIDARDNLEMNVTPGGEYFLRDKLYGTGMHTFIKRHENDRQEVLDKMARRIKYLKDSLIDDLEDAEKILVYKSDDPLDGQTHARLRSAVAQYNPKNCLMIVQVAKKGGVSGVPEPKADGLLVAHLDRPSKRQGVWDISFESWLEICRSARALRA